jgi:hypothetical protein
MSIHSLSRIFFVFLILGCVAMLACNNSNVAKIPDLPYLQADSLQRFRVGERFILAVGKNSCCMYCWQGNSGLEDEIPRSTLVKYIETVEDQADPDCAGCSNFYYHIYECVSSGIDTLSYGVIPMGSVGGASDCSELQLPSVDTGYFRNYIITVLKQ